MLHALISARASRRFAIFVTLVACTGAIALMRARGDVPLTPDSVRDAIQSWGPLAPLIFTGAFVVRPFVFFPSTLLFLAGGLAFGVAWGTLYAAAGGTVGAIVGFGIARLLGRDFIQAQFGELLPNVQRDRWGAGLVFLLNLMPIVPMTAINYGAGLSGMDVVPFSIAVAVGLTPRAFAYSFFGNSLLDVGSREFQLAIALLLILLVVPLLLRQYLLRRARRDALPNGV